MAKTDDKACPCGGKVYATCCLPYHSGAAVADTPDKLMRARYSAYVTLNEEYLQATWHPSTRPEEAVADMFVTWLGLDVKSSSQQGDEGKVHFVARCREGGRGRRMEEISRFVREDGLWFYVDGEFVDKRGQGVEPAHAPAPGHSHSPDCDHGHSHGAQDAPAGGGKHSGSKK